MARTRPSDLLRKESLTATLTRHAHDGSTAQNRVGSYDSIGRMQNGAHMYFKNVIWLHNISANVGSFASIKSAVFTK